MPLRRFLHLLSLLVVADLQAAVEIKYWLWDSNQLPAYRAVARAFEQANPDVRIKITHVSASDYWISLTTSMIAESAPDVFTNHLSKYPELVANGTLLDLTAFAARDRLEPASYMGRLYELWSKDGRQYGIPKDWDTIAIAYNRILLERAGVSPTELEHLDWNPRNGGSFGRMLARLSRDESGEIGLSPRFNPARVKIHGLLIDGKPDGAGQVDWGSFAVSNGFRHHDAPWSQNFYYDDPRLLETLHWLRDMSRRKGFIVPTREAREIRAAGLFAAERGVLLITGSWMINWLAANTKFPFGFAPLPIGPEGRKSMMNGLGDSIWSGTRHPEAAWRWTRFLGSPTGQHIVARHGVVFPAIRSAAEEATVAMGRKIAGVSVFLQQATAPDGTFLFPIADHGNDMHLLTRGAMDRIFLTNADIKVVLETLNRDVRRLFDRPD